MSERIVAEPRWPMTLAVVFVIVLTAGLKERLSVAPRWVFPAGMAILDANWSGEPWKKIGQSGSFHIS